MNHPFFAGVDWMAVQNKQVRGMRTGNRGLANDVGLCACVRHAAAHEYSMSHLSRGSLSPVTPQIVPPFRPTVNVLESDKTVRGWSEKDRAKLATVSIVPADQVRRLTCVAG